ncbi:CBS domain containing protein [Secundilactobacillus pentosiphilus]|uniref:CBS domain containing protein n=1 Tax=Secundilactobacillus pentosiphilus TaxID=1714682 RepID=A0A1Z5IVF6_9LACO|nr:helix-turn-helix transcriptional regulator [Secundilactobacillus pentosiphilus]GAX04371.1 CBS domain containing protein [Secundilactobacillus pentosiphilus]GAX05669.1 CBS domain containing protein [Secundilactobacillus pentosiphilus]
MEFTERQQKIVQMLKAKSPLTGEEIANQLGLSVPTIRADLRLLTAVEVLTARPKVGYVYRGDGHAGVDYTNLYEKPISAIMQPAITIKDDATLQEAISKLFLRDVGTLLVVDQKDHLAGLISRKDLLRASFNNSNPEAILASVIMTRMPNIITVTADTTVKKAGQLLLKHKVDSLPVVDQQAPQRVTGRITKNRIFQHFIEQA